MKPSLMRIAHDLGTVCAVGVVLVGVSCATSTGPVVDQEPTEIARALPGRWKKITSTPCSAPYPAELEFLDYGVYYGRQAGSGVTFWDAGEYRIRSAHEMSLSTANDMTVVYQFTLANDTLTFVDADKCEFKFTRIS